MAKRDSEQRNQALQREKDAAQRERETAQREKDRLKQERDTLARFTSITSHNLLLITLTCMVFNHDILPTCSEKLNLEKTVQAAQSSHQMLQMDNEKLQLAVASAQREQDHEREEKEVAIQERDRARAETQRM